MAGETLSPHQPLEGKEQLISYLEAGCKPEKDWRIGTEHEKFAYHLADLKPLEYEGSAGVRALLEGLIRFDWQPVLENGNPIALSKPDGSFISLEPAGQIELSGAPVETIHQTCDEVTGHLQQVKAIARELGIGFLGLGHRAKWPGKDMPWMPKGRYKIMREYMPKKGKLGLEMMQSTCTVQVNLDFDSEATMVQMFRIALALQLVGRIRLSRKENPPGFCPTAATSGPTPIPTAAACCRSFSRTGSVSNVTSITCSTCPCTSFTATETISTPQGNRSGILWKAICRRFPVKSPRCPTGSTI